MTQNEKGLQHEMEHKATVEAIIADAEAGKLKSVEEYVQMFADDHVAKIPDYYDRLEEMEKAAGAGSESEAEEDEDEECEDDTPDEKEDKRVSRAYKAVSGKKAVSLEQDKPAEYTEK